MRLFVSIYGDGALLDARKSSPDSLRHDDELDEEGKPGETAIIQLDGVPDEVGARALDYVSGNSGPSPYRDGYEATECILAAVSSKVLSCTVNREDGWSTADCKRLGGCYLCGGMHDH